MTYDAEIASLGDQGASEFYTKYEPKEILGKGLCSTVRKCVEKSTQRAFAVKIIDLVGPTNGEAIRATSRMEVELLKACSSHSNVIRLEEAFETPAFMFLVFEICPHGELFENLTKNVTFSEKKTRNYMHQILDSVRYLHSRGIIHRDIKAENILFDKDMKLKLSDFGFATRITDRHTLRELLGTPGYLSPEMLSASMNEFSPDYGLEVDMWACGVVMYTMLSGSPPFWHRKQMKLLRLIMEGTYCFPSPQWDEITDAAKDLIRRMLTVSPLKRITAKEALQHPFFVIGGEKENGMSCIRKFKSVGFLIIFIQTTRNLARLRTSVSVDSLVKKPYSWRPLRKGIDAITFQMYGHWVKSGDSQSRAALFQTKKIIRKGLSFRI